MRLSPLRDVAHTLEARLAAAADAPGRAPGGGARPAVGWTAAAALRSGGGGGGSGRRAPTDELGGARRIVEACAGDVRALWAHPGAEAARCERRAALDDEAA